MSDNKILANVKSIYLVGIGGIGMTGLAFLLKEKGLTVKGSDIQDGYTVKMLRDAGIEVFIGHKKENLPQELDMVAYSSAIKDDNPEIIEAKARKLTMLRRGELLGLLSWDRKTIAVAGSHGKTTTSAFIGYLLTALGSQPTVFVGGVPLNYEKNAWWGKDYFVIETDESDGSFLYYNPWVSVITNIDKEHLDHYKNFEILKESFLKFAYQTKGLVIGCGDDPSVRHIISQVNGVSYGFEPENKFSASNIGFDGTYTTFSLLIDNEFKSHVKIPLLGSHNVLNSLAVFAFFNYLGEDFSVIIDLMRNFKGTRRRFQIKAQVAGVTFVDDYAHHPTEIQAVLKAAHSLSPKRVVAVFQPHRFSRVKALHDEFSNCFKYADLAIVTDIYSASETPIEGISGKLLFEEIDRLFPGKARYIAKEQLVEEVPLVLEEGDIVLGLGAGDINSIMENIVGEFKKNKVNV